MAEQRKGDMTVSEAGRLGGNTVKQKYGPEFFSKIGELGGEHSWTTGAAGAKVPMITDEDKQRANEIRQRIDRGEDVSIHDVAFLGGLERVIQTREKLGK